MPAAVATRARMVGEGWLMMLLLGAVPAAVAARVRMGAGGRPMLLMLGTVVVLVERWAQLPLMAGVVAALVGGWLLLLRLDVVEVGVVDAVVRGLGARWLLLVAVTAAVLAPGVVLVVPSSVSAVEVVAEGEVAEADGGVTV